MELYPDFREFFALFKARDVRYLIVGGYALGFHGYVRYTGDIDAWVEPTPENSRRVVAAFADFGFGSMGLEPDAFARPNVIVQIGRPPLRIDVMTSPSGVEFEACYRDRVVMEADGLALDVIGLDGLKANKAASGRPKDLGDLSQLP